jgi:hypothetical protein
VTDERGIVAIEVWTIIENIHLLCNKKIRCTYKCRMQGAVYSYIGGCQIIADKVGSRDKQRVEALEATWKSVVDSP